MDKVKLNIGCGKDYLEGYTNLDISPHVGADIVCNIEDYMPFRKDIFDEILCNNVLTQIFHPDSFVQVMNDLWKICKPNGEIFIRVPNAKHICAWQDPMDCRRFTDQSFTYMQYDHRRYNQYGIHYGFRPFKVVLLEDNGVQMRFKLCPIKQKN